MMPRYVLLDRDGVINVDSDLFIKSPEEWQPIPGSLDAIARLNEFGYKVIVITNQSGLARGLFDLNTLEKIHDKMQASVKTSGGSIEAIYFCPHGPHDGCDCRKPGTGMLKAFARDYRVPLEQLPFIGDSLKDIQAARAVGAQPMLVKTGKGMQTINNNPKLNVLVFEKLYDAAEFIVTHH
jgi:D-glycero-D-manno-heptose 1,7-bisphosphate phosphatase